MAVLRCQFNANITENMNVDETRDEVIAMLNSSKDAYLPFHESGDLRHYSRAIIHAVYRGESDFAKEQAETVPAQ